MAWIDLGGEGRGRGHPGPGRARTPAAAALAARGRSPPPSGRARSPSPPTARARCSSRTATPPTSGSSTCARGRARAPDHRPRPDALLGGHRPAALARRHAGRLRRGRPRLARAAAGGPPRAASRPARRSGSPTHGSSSRSSATTPTRLAVVDIADPWPRRLAAPWRPRGARRRGRGRRLAGRHPRWPTCSPPRADLNRPEIRVVALDGGAVRALTGTPRMQDRAPAWSPDGAHPRVRLRALGLVGAAPRRGRRLGRAAAYRRRRRPRRARLAPGR